MLMLQFPNTSIIWPFIYLAFLVNAGASNKNFCPHSNVSSVCSCYNSDDGPFVECSRPNYQVVRQILGEIESPVKSVSIVDLEDGLGTVTRDFFPVKTVIKQVEFLRSNVVEIEQNAFENIKSNLSSIGFISGRLTKIPQKALSGLQALRVLDLATNAISNVPNYCFYGLKLVKVSLKGNSLETISEHAFAGLEKSLTEVDLTENKLKSFPISSLRFLEHLTLVRLAWNQILEIVDDGYSRLSSLHFLDLSSNQFETIPSNCFRPMPSLTFLSLYQNAVESVHRDAFVALIMLESLDISHNRISFLDPAVFRFNKRLKTLDLSNNHVHYIGGLFERLGELREIFLIANNILEVPRDAFTDCSSLTAIYLEENAVRRLDSEAFQTLPNLMQIYMSSNYIKYIPRDLFANNSKLTSLSFDNNRILELEPGTFENLSALREIRLQNNRIEEIKSGVFFQLPSLMELNLGNNRIRTVEPDSFRTLAHLQHINLQENFLDSLTEVFDQEMPSFVSISLNSNRINSLRDVTFRLQENVQILWLGHNHISSLNRVIFKDFRNMKRLYLNNNSISAIEDRTFESMQQLNVLDLSRNRLTRITRYTLQDLRELEELSLANNNIEFIESFALTSLKKIRVLDCTGNRMKKLQANVFQDRLPLRTLKLKSCHIEEIEEGTFKGLGNLLELDLENNRIRPDSLSNLEIPGLVCLKAAGNAFGSFKGSRMTRLESLEIFTLDNSSVRHIPEEVFSGNSHLRSISLSNNALENLSKRVFHGLSNLSEVNLSGNFFSSMPHEALEGLTNLKTLNLTNNFMTFVNFSYLDGIPRLQVLDFRNNKITFLTGFSGSNLTEVTDVYLSRNFLSGLPVDLFSRSKKLRHLDLSENRFTAVPLPGVESLKRLELTGNPLKEINEPNNTGNGYLSVEELKISRTNLSSVTAKDFEVFSGLLHLDLSENRLAQVSPGAFRRLSSLLTLNLSLNELNGLPQDRLAGLTQLKLLNLSSNQLEELKGFSPDLRGIQILDLSDNKLTRLEKSLFAHLGRLEQLHLTGNWISSISIDSFKHLKRLLVLDLRRNYLEDLPLNAFEPLEGHIRYLRVEENPISCGCEQQELWEWLQDHRKLVGPATRDLKCEHPVEVRGLPLMEMPPYQFCSSPLVVKLGIQDIQPYSIVISWQSRNHSGLHGYTVFYSDMEANKSVQIELLDRNVRSLRVNRLEANRKYLICVVGLSTWVTVKEGETYKFPFNSTLELHPLFDASVGKCTQVKTLETPEIAYGKGSGEKWDSSNSILTRRLGLIVGCCLGSIVFFILVSILGYMKIQKQRRVCNRNQPLPSEYVSYRHFSIHNADTVLPSSGPIIGASITYF